MSAYPNLFEVLDDNGDVIAQEIDRKSKIIVKEAPTTTKKKETPKKEEKKPESTEQATDGFEVKGQNKPPRQPKAEKTSPGPQSSGRGGRGRGGRLDRPPRAEGDNAQRRQDGEPRPPRSDRPRGERPPRVEGEGHEERPSGERAPRRERPPRQEGDQPRQEGDQPRRRPRQEGDQPRQPREYRPPRDNVEGEENPRPYRERRNFDGPRDNDESGERRYNEDRPRGGRGGRGGRGRGFYNNRAASENGHDLAEGAPIESEPNQRPQRRPREDKLTDEKGFVQPKQRAYERRSGTGRTDDVKRGGRGANNWGVGTDENLDAYSETVATQERALDNEAVPSESAQAEGEIPAQAEGTATRENKEEEKTITLKEYRESQGKELAQIELPKPRQAGEDSKDTWNNFKVLKKDDHNLQLSVIAPSKDKKATKENPKTELPATKAKSRGSKVPVQDILKIKAEPRQDRRREYEPKDKAGQSPKTKASAPTPAKIDKNSKDFPALATAKN